MRHTKAKELRQLPSKKLLELFLYWISYAEILAYRSLSSTSIITAQGDMEPPATMEKIRGVQPETSATPCSFMVTG